MSCDLVCCPSHTDTSKVEKYSTLVDSIQDADTLADRLYAKGVIVGNVREMVEGCSTSREKNKVLIAAIQQQVGVNSESFQTIIDVLKMDRSNDTAASLLTGKEGPKLIRYRWLPRNYPLLHVQTHIGKEWG